MNVLIAPDQIKDPGQEIVIPDHLHPYLVPWSTRQYRQYKFGTILTQTFLHKHYRIYIYRFMITQPVNLFFAVDEPTIALRHMLEGNVYAEVQGFGRVELEPQRYNLIYLPTSINEAWFEAGPAESLHMELEYTWLEEMAESNEEIAELMNRVMTVSNEGKLMLPALIDYNVNEALHAMRHSQETGGLLLMEFKTGILKILTQYGKVLKEQDQLDGLPEIPNKELLVKIWEMVKANPHIHHTLARLARMNHMHEKTLSRHFQRLFKISLPAFVHKQCMARAYYLITTTEQNLSDIAYDLGYTEISNFNRAFKKHHGIPPQALRNMR